MTTLVIGNKRYSSWSLRPWILLRELGIPFDEVLIPLDQPDTRAAILAYSPAGRVPVLIDGAATVWDSLAILGHVSEEMAPGRVWPRDRVARAMARSVAAEMHSGFAALRSAMPMDLGARYAHRDRGEAAAGDVARVCEIVRTAREIFGASTRKPFLFGEFSGADAMFAPVVTRLDTYCVPLDPVCQAYVDAVLALPSFRTWREAAIAEPWVIPHGSVDEEPIAVFRDETQGDAP